MKNEWRKRNKKIRNLLDKTPNIGSWLKDCNVVAKEKYLYILTPSKFVLNHLNDKRVDIAKAVSKEGIAEVGLYLKDDFLRELANFKKDESIKDVLGEAGEYYSYRYFLKAIQLLLVLPKFNEEVEKIRKKYGINPNKLKEERNKVVGNKRTLRLIKSFEKASGFIKEFERYFRYWKQEQKKGDKFKLGLQEYKENFSKAAFNKIVEAAHRLAVWERQICPDLVGEIGHLRLNVLGKIPRSWSPAIKNYVLYGEISDYPFLVRKSENMPEMDMKVDLSGEPYIEIKIYGHTDLTNFNLTENFIRKAQRHLPTYGLLKNSKKHYEVVYRRWMYYYLRKKMGLKHREVNNWLKYYGFPKIGYQYGSQEIRRFQKTFLK